MKHHRENQSTGSEYVQRLAGWKGDIFGVGLLVTNTQFTRDAIWAAKMVQENISCAFVMVRLSGDGWMTTLAIPKRPLKCLIRLN
ncbi:MAG: hypothetical protein H7039_10225 [Bryobacteraceae bacterium]|nr:hypothetical protein [Bryobacteraceae bacterium]